MVTTINRFLTCSIRTIHAFLHDGLEALLVIQDRETVITLAGVPI